MIKRIGILIFALLLFGCTNAQKNKEAKVYPVTKTEAEWKVQLSEMEFFVLRQAGTERAFTSPLNKNYAEGLYVCVACDTPVFRSENKFDSRTGWPSFDTAIKGNVGYDVDYKIGHARIEEHCNTCGGHLGHVFDDGPRATTGKRHCINGVALKFIPKKTNESKKS